MVLVLRSFVRGPLEPYVAGFADELARLGYTRCSAEQHVCFVAHLDRWLTAQRLGVGDLGVAVVERYLAERRAAGYVNYRSVKAVRPLLSFLDRLGVLPQEQVELGPVPALLERYRSYLLSERGLTVGTARCYLDAVRPFVTSRLRGEEVDWAGLTAADVTRLRGGGLPGTTAGHCEADRDHAAVTADLLAHRRRDRRTVGRRGAVGGRLAVGRAAPGARAGAAAAAAGRL